MTGKINILDNKLDAVKDILLRSQVQFKYCKYLNTREKFYECHMIKKYAILDYARVSFIIVLILDLCKLFNYDTKENYNLKKILDITINQYSHLHFAHPISKEELLHLSEDLNSLRIMDIATKLKTLRNKHYAHLDSNRPEIMKIMPTFDEFEFLLGKAFSLYSKLNFHLYDTSVLIVHGNADNGDDILTQLIKLENNLIEEYL